MHAQVAGSAGPVGGLGLIVAAGIVKNGVVDGCADDATEAVELIEDGSSQGLDGVVVGRVGVDLHQ